MLISHVCPGSLRRLLTGAALAAVLFSPTALSVAAQTVSPGLNTITVAGTGVATAPAETARIQIVVGANLIYSAMPMGDAAAISGDGGAITSTSDTQTAASPASETITTTDTMAGPVVDPNTGEIVVTAEDLQPVVDALVAAGIDAEAITVVTGPAVTGWYGAGSFGSGLIELTVEQPTLVGVTALIEAASAAATGTLAVQQVGVEYGLAECAELVDASQAAAFQNARTRAEALGAHIGATVEAPVQVTDYNATILPISDTNSCPPSPELAYLVGSTQAFNTPSFNAAAPAEARVVTQLTVTYDYELAQP